jgi:hypothetical protein
MSADFYDAEDIHVPSFALLIDDEYPAALRIPDRQVLAAERESYSIQRISMKMKAVKYL